MAWTIEIREGDAKPVNLDDVLTCLEPEAIGGLWTIVELEGITKPNGAAAQPLADLQDQIEGTLHGLDVPWQRLQEIVAAMDDIWDGLFVAWRNEHPRLPRAALFAAALSAYADVIDSCDFIVERHDSSFWWVASREHGPMARLQERFRSAGARELHT